MLSCNMHMCATQCAWYKYVHGTADMVSLAMQDRPKTPNMLGQEGVHLDIKCLATAALGCRPHSLVEHCALSLLRACVACAMTDFLKTCAHDRQQCFACHHSSN